MGVRYAFAQHCKFATSSFYFDGREPLPQGLTPTVLLPLQARELKAQANKAPTQQLFKVAHVAQMMK
jgi:hypothetical protein